MNKRTLPGLAEHLEYLFKLKRKTRERHPDFIALRDILKREGYWRRRYNMLPYMRKRQRNNVANINNIRKNIEE